MSCVALISGSLARKKNNRLLAGIATLQTQQTRQHAARHDCRNTKTQPSQIPRTLRVLGLVQNRSRIRPVKASSDSLVVCCLCGFFIGMSVCVCVEQGGGANTRCVRLPCQLARRRGRRGRRGPASGVGPGVASSSLLSAAPRALCAGEGAHAGRQLHSLPPPFGPTRERWRLSLSGSLVRSRVSAQDVYPPGRAGVGLRA